MTAAAVVDATSAAAVAEPQTDALKELLSDCTCPICQELYTNPQQLACGHTFCLRCFDKLKRKWRKASANGRGADSLLRFTELLSMRMGSGGGGGSGNSSDGDPLLCPVCRSSIDPYKPVRPDPTAGALLMTLHAVKAGCCKQTDCWRPPQVCCTDCTWGLCAEHHRLKLETLRADCRGLAEEAERFLQAKTEEAGRMGAELAEAEDRLIELGRTLAQAVQDRMDKCRGQLSQERLDWALETRQLSQETKGLSSDAAQLRQLVDNWNDHQHQEPDAIQLMEVATRRRQLEGHLRTARVRFPPSRLELGFEPDKVAAEYAALLGGVSARLLKRPYAERPDTERLRPIMFRRTKRGEPWEVRLMGEDRLLINYKGFPTRRLHVFSAGSLTETGTVELEMTQTQFPGQTCVCTRRSRILASDPKNHCVYEFDFQGRITAQFGSKGSEPGQLHSPKGLYPYEGTLYVVDSKNKRVQLYDMDQGYQCLGFIEHDSLSGNIQAVLAGPECVVVCDRGSDSLVVFERATRRFLKKLPAGGEPFDACVDQFDNVIVSLTRERKVKVFDPSVTHCINTFSVSAVEGAEDAVSDSSRPLKGYLHGLAFDGAKGRLFVAEAFAKRLLGFDMQA